MSSIREQLDTQLRRFEELERKMSDPAVQAEGSEAGRRRPRARLARQAGHQVSPLQVAGR